MNFNTVVVSLLLTAASSKAAFLRRSGANEKNNHIYNHHSERRQLNTLELEVSVRADVEALQKCVNEDHPVTVFYSARDRVNLALSQTTTHSITQTGAGLHFGIQVNDWYWRSNANPYTGQWLDNAGMEVIINDASTCDFELTKSWGDPNAPDARDVLDLTSSKTASGCSFSVTRKANPSLHIAKDFAYYKGPCRPMHQIN